MDQSSVFRFHRKTSGNAGTTPGTHFLGTTDNQPLELMVNGARALRLEPNTNGAPNVIGGAAINFVAAGVVGATIGGGGGTNYFGFVYTNSVSGDFGTIAGGILNAIGTDASHGAIGGGVANNIAANASVATISGGEGYHIGKNSTTALTPAPLPLS